MFCPQCGSTQGDDLKFCKSCGANLHALRRVMASRDESEEKFDWSKTWVAEMFVSGEEAVRRQAAIDRLQGKTPEVRRRNEIKAGIITASSGLGLMLVLSVIMEGIIIAGNLSALAAEILSRVWIVGVLPLLVGIALIINGMFISKRGEEPVIHQTDADTDVNLLEHSKTEGYLSPAETNPLALSVPFSVTDETTRHLGEPVPVKRKSE